MLKHFLGIMVPDTQGIPNQKLFVRVLGEVVVWDSNGEVYTLSLEEVAMKSFLICSENTIRMGD
jgi:hypothetical protein